MPQSTPYQTPSVQQLKELFGDKLTEIKVDQHSSDVDEFVNQLENAMRATKEHSIQF